MSNCVICVHFGEVIERDQNVAVECLASGENISDCVWAFRSLFSTSGVDDLLYVNSTRVNCSSISQKLNTERLLRASHILLGGRGSRDSGDLEDVKSFIRSLVEW